MPLPAPPIRTMTDFVVFVFASIVILGLVAGWVGVVILYVKGDDAGGLVNSLMDLTTTVLGALVGFIAGKGSGRAEVVEELSAVKAQE